MSEFCIYLVNNSFLEGALNVLFVVKISESSLRKVKLVIE